MVTPGNNTGQDLPRQVLQMLTRLNARLVLAESCTCGLAAALLGQVPGISNFFCGSAVTYRDDTKRNWLSISSASIATETSVSGPVTQAMARAVLERTPEAHLAAAITGHLGPYASADCDGKIWIATAEREYGKVTVHAAESHQLLHAARAPRQAEAARRLFEAILAAPWRHGDADASEKGS